MPAPYVALEPGTWSAAAWPPGARHDAAAGAVAFAVHAPHATRVLLELYDAPTGADAAASFDLDRNPADGTWRGRVAGAAPGALYAFRCWGPNWPSDPAWRRGGSAAGFVADFDAAGHRFNSNKVLFDPYAREVSHERASGAMRAAGHDGGMFGTGEVPYRDRPRREFDTGPWAPKGVVVACDVPTGTRPHVPAENAAIYEAHVRNLTAHPSASTLRTTLAGIPGFEAVRDVPPAWRGTFRGAACMAPYLKALGFTVIELMPVMETDNGPASKRAGTFNHWGYMTLGFLAPDRDLAFDRSPGGPTAEFRDMVRAFHDEGIEVYLDVVFNHTAEGGNWGGRQDTVGFVSLGGFDTPGYYALTDRHHLVDGATGCGNQLNFSNEATRRLVLDTLAYWVDEMGVDGFRFDLAPVLGRLPEDVRREDWEGQKRFFPRHPLLEAIAAFGAARDVEVIAEAWDLWGNVVGNFPSGWGEWNGRYRDAVRRFLKGDGNLGEFMSMVNGDWEHFSDQGGAQKSIDFVTAHDGFTLLDLVSYNGKNNHEAWPFGPSDGGNDGNDAWDSGGDRALRRQRIRNFWTVLFLSRGVPLAVSGDELCRTQNGNNNPWNLDTVGIWNNWAMAATNRPTAAAVDPDDPSIRYHDNFGEADCDPGVNPFFRFAAFVARLRRDHPALRQRAWGDLAAGGGDVSYVFAAPDGGAPGTTGRAVRVHVDGSGVGDRDLLELINQGDAPLAFAVPPAAPGRRWVRIVDTAAWAEPHCNAWAPGEAGTVEEDYVVHPWSIAVLQEIGD